MVAPWYVYVIALVSAAPIYALLAIGAYMLVRSIISWVLAPEAPASNPAAAPKGHSLGG